MRFRNKPSSSAIIHRTHCLPSLAHSANLASTIAAAGYLGRYNPLHKRFLCDRYPHSSTLVGEALANVQGLPKGQRGLPCVGL